MPVMTPLELWQHTKRDRIQGLFRLKDRAGPRLRAPDDARGRRSRSTRRRRSSTGSSPRSSLLGQGAHDSLARAAVFSACASSS